MAAVAREESSSSHATEQGLTNASGGALPFTLYVLMLYVTPEQQSPAAVHVGLVPGPPPLDNEITL